MEHHSPCYPRLICVQRVGKSMDPTRQSSSDRANQRADPKPPRLTLLDWFGIVLFALLGAPFLFLCIDALYEAIFGDSRNRSSLIWAALLCAGLPGIACWWRAWRIFVGRKR